MVMDVKRRKTAITSLAILTLIAMSNMLAFANGPNLVLNPSVEQGYPGPDSWSLNGAAYFSNEGHTGIHSIGINAIGSDGWTTCMKFSVDENSSYQFVFWVKGTYTAGSWTAQIRWFNSVGTWLGQINILVSGVYSEWTCVNETVTPPATTVQSDVMVYAASSPEGNILFDDFSVSQVTTAPSDAEVWINEMFFGSGFWLTAIIILAIIFITVWIVPYSGALFLPLCVFLGIEYFSKIETSSPHMWGVILMMFASVYIIVVMAIKIRSK
jgi:hypothetical protein